MEKPPPGARISSRKRYIAGRSMSARLLGEPISQRVRIEAKVGALQRGEGRGGEVR
jgi:hypothetical protein